MTLKQTQLISAIWRNLNDPFGDWTTPQALAADLGWSVWEVEAWLESLQEEPERLCRAAYDSMDRGGQPVMTVRLTAAGVAHAERVAGAAAQPGSTAENGEGEDWLTRPVGIVAKEWNMQAKRVERWRRIYQEYIPGGLTQERMADKEFGGINSERLSVETIKADVRDMRAKGLIPTP
jgi:hypothetical protein